MITKLPPVGFKILQISLQIMHHFLSRLCWPLLKVHFAGHAHVKLVLDVGMWVTDWECGSLVTNFPRAASPFCGFLASFSFKYDVTDAILQDIEKTKVQYIVSLLFDLFEILQAVRSEQTNFA